MSGNLRAVQNLRRVFLTVCLERRRCADTRKLNLGSAAGALGDSCSPVMRVSNLFDDCKSESRTASRTCITIGENLVTLYRVDTRTIIADSEPIWECVNYDRHAGPGVSHCIIEEVFKELTDPSWVSLKLNIVIDDEVSISSLQNTPAFTSE
jgi:hypothetical protein